MDGINKNLAIKPSIKVWIFTKRLQSFTFDLLEKN